VAWTVNKKVIWFLEGTAEEGTVMGSAVAVRLRRYGERPKTYLLTCAHVVRGATLDGPPVKGAGPVSKDLRGWRSGAGHTPAQARSLRVVARGTPESDDDELLKEHRATAYDWVLLEIENELTAEASPAVPDWAGAEPIGPISIWGFPGGRRFREDKVEPIRTYDSLMPDAIDGCVVHDGAMEVVGDTSRPGMSGGGLFDSEGRFAGLHQSKRDKELRLVAVAADHIRLRLQEQGFYVVPDVSRAAELAGILGSGASGVDWRAVRNRWLPPPSTYTEPQDIDDDDALLDALLELGKYGPDQRGLRPLHGFALDLNEQGAPAGLAEWIRKNVPAEFEGQPLHKPPAPQGEPRIVIELTPLGPAGDKSALRSIEYKIWFVGFGSSPPRKKEEDQLGQFSAVLERAWDAIRGQADFKTVWVELFLPKELLAWKVESLDIRLGKFPVRIGATHPFVLRLKRKDPLRLEAEAFDRSLRLHRYDSFDSIPKTCCSHVLVESRGDSDPGDLYTALEGKEKVLGVLWTSHPQTGENEDADVWDAVNQAGVPLVVWLREIPEARPDVGAEFHDKTWDELAGVLRDLRNTGARSKGAWHLGQHLAVILDDNQRNHPEMMPFRSPHVPAN
jgi:hypothetical protein